MAEVCPLLSIAHPEQSTAQCIQKACMWWVAKDKQRKILVGECVIMKMNTHSWDTWLTIRNVGNELKDALDE
jgi:hypothetical protein